MDICECCKYSYTENKETWGGLFSKEVLICRLMNKEVSPKGTCNEFTEKYNEINMGYRSNVGCFLTSACVEYMGKADDCAELTALRNFRDNYMNATEEGKILIKEYYKVAPQIVKHITASPQRNIYYKYIYDIICDCLKLLKKGDNAAVLKMYKNMVLNLKKECNIK